MKIKSNVKFGLPPGTVIYTGDRTDLETKYELVVYNSEQFLHTHDNTFEEVKEKTELNKWSLIKGFKDAAGINYLSAAFGMPSLILEDVLNVNQRSHICVHDNSICVIVRYYNLDYRRKQVSFWLTEDILISYQETHDEFFEVLFKRLDSENSETRTKKLDRLLVVLLDYMVDLYYSTADQVDEEITSLENHIITSNDPADHLTEIYQMKNKVQGILSDVKSFREVLDSLADDFDMQFTPESIVYIKDIHNHTVQLIDTFEGFKNTLSSIVDLSAAVSGNKMNEIMKFLTVLSTFFLPLSFLTGWYGMNFEMPEQKANPVTGYYVMIGTSLLITAGLLYWFKKKKWL
jgi:magnesium transporter